MRKYYTYARGQMMGPICARGWKRNRLNNVVDNVLPKATRRRISAWLWSGVVAVAGAAVLLLRLVL